MHPSVEAAWPRVAREHEGVLAWPYLDRLGLVTVGIGSLMDTATGKPPPAFLALPWVWDDPGQSVVMRDTVAAGWHAVKARTDLAPRGGRAFREVTHLRLPDATMDALLLGRTRQFWAVLAEQLPDLEQWPADAQLALIDCAYQGGPRFLRVDKPGRAELRAAAERADFAACATWCANPNASPTRNARRARWFVNAATVARLGLDPAHLWDTETPTGGVMLPVNPSQGSEPVGTQAPAAIAAMYPPLEARYGRGAVKRGGIVGDLAHKRRGGFHISRQDQPSSNYSVRGFNRNGPGNWAAAIDITLSDTLMRLFSARLRAAVDRDDPRVEGCVFEWFGTLNSRTVTGDLLYDTINRASGRTSSDSSHLWHVHISIRRDRITLARTMALVDVLLGVPREAPTPPKPAPAPAPVTPPQEEPMAISPADVDTIIDTKAIPNPNPAYVRREPEVSLSQLARSTYRAAQDAEDRAARIEGVVGDLATKAEVAAVNGKLDRVLTALAQLAEVEPEPTPDPEPDPEDPAEPAPPAEPPVPAP